MELRSAIKVRVENEEGCLRSKLEKQEKDIPCPYTLTVMSVMTILLGMAHTHVWSNKQIRNYMNGENERI